MDYYLISAIGCFIIAAIMIVRMIKSAKTRNYNGKISHIQHYENCIVRSNGIIDMIPEKNEMVNTVI
jgi:hypothetical protein